jgi:hypothetical protein
MIGGSHQASRRRSRGDESGRQERCPQHTNALCLNTSQRQKFENEKPQTVTQPGSKSSQTAVALSRRSAKGVYNIPNLVCRP